MDCEEICQRIKMQIHHYWNVFNTKPNRIILGKTVYDFMIASNQALGITVKQTGLKYAFGIPVVVNHDNPHEISVGYVEEINL